MFGKRWRRCVSIFCSRKSKVGLMNTHYISSLFPPSLFPPDLSEPLVQPNLTYSEKKLVREYLEKQIELNCQPVVELFEKYTNNQLTKVAHMQTDSNEEVLRLETRRQDLTRDLGRLKNEKNELLKQCADLRVAAHQKHTVGLLNAEMRYTEVKAKTMENIMRNEAVSRTQNSQKAIKQVENHLDEILKK
jgi:hypothetical protein